MDSHYQISSNQHTTWSHRSTITLCADFWHPHTCHLWMPCQICLYGTCCTCTNKCSISKYTHTHTQVLPYRYIIYSTWFVSNWFLRCTAHSWILSLTVHLILLAHKTGMHFLDLANYNLIGWISQLQWVRAEYQALRKNKSLDLPIKNKKTVRISAIYTLKYLEICIKILYISVQVATKRLHCV